MPTLADMKARIRREIFREDLDDAIALEITSAIASYRAKRFFFTERRGGVTFSTVSGQSDYSAAANAGLPHLIDIDEVSIAVPNGLRLLEPVDPVRMDLWLGASPSPASSPTAYSYYGQSMRFYPRPDKAYPITVSGVFRVAAPATDTEADNPWMNDAEELIRARAKSRLYASWTGDFQSAQAMDAMETTALNDLVAETSRRSSFRDFRGDWL